MEGIIIYAVLLFAGGIAGGVLTATVLRKAILKKSEALLEETKEKSEVIKKEKMLQAKEKFLELKSMRMKNEPPFMYPKTNSLSPSENRVRTFV